MKAAMLVLEPVFEADLPPELYAYRAGRNAQQAVVEVEELLFGGHPDVVDADLADYFGSIPYADLRSTGARGTIALGARVIGGRGSDSAGAAKGGISGRGRGVCETVWRGAGLSFRL
jgi:hypothetical protein